jgi:hypothetical protein
MSQLDQSPKDRAAMADWRAPSSEKPASHDSDMTRINREREEIERKMFSSGNWERFYEPDSDAQGRAIVPDRAKTWNKNGYTLAAQSSRGEKYVTPWEQERENELTAIGFEKNEKMGVPYSTEMPADPNIRVRWQKLLEAKSHRERMHKTE